MGNAEPCQALLSSSNLFSYLQWRYAHRMAYGLCSACWSIQLCRHSAETVSFICSRHGHLCITHATRPLSSHAWSSRLSHTAGLHLQDRLSSYRRLGNYSLSLHPSSLSWVRPWPVCCPHGPRPMQAAVEIDETCWSTERCNRDLRIFSHPFLLVCR